ncbi:cysteine-rich KTR domain-containing protein [Undibacterium seohonense]|uniref:cysteine-rich KTR domain-containing protein n=1 Tax=Undibacterium seohonense TaxID=1344950 RepID=UPI003CCCB217
MAITPLPTNYSCPTCGWKKTFSPRSDALIESYPTYCPVCNEKNIRIQNGSHAIAGFQAIVNDIKKFFS